MKYIDLEKVVEDTLLSIVTHLKKSALKANDLLGLDLVVIVNLRTTNHNGTAIGGTSSEGDTALEKSFMEDAIAKMVLSKDIDIDNVIKKMKEFNDDPDGSFHSSRRVSIKGIDDDGNITDHREITSESGHTIRSDNDENDELNKENSLFDKLKKKFKET